MRNSKYAEELFQKGCDLYFADDASIADRRKGLDHFRRAAALQHAEAMFLFGRILLSDRELGILQTKQTRENAWKSIYDAAAFGSLSAKHFLDQMCRERYEEKFPPRGKGSPSGPLKDFDGNVIKIRRTGLLTPVDAVLEYKGGENILTLQADLYFDGLDEMGDPDKEEIFRSTVTEGILAWEGSYEVFGGQQLRIVMDITQGQNSFDRIRIIAGSRQLDQMITETYQKVPWANPSVYENSAAVTSFGFRKWTASSRKFILFRNAEKLTEDRERLKHYAKHEFGHVLGLGDLYRSAVHGLKGADSKGFAELESYEIIPQKYNLVMDNAVGPISNNDIEMVILAFSENRMQSYQPDKVNQFVSEALGKGN